MTEFEIDEARRLAERQYEAAMEQGNTGDCIGFDHNGQFVINPWLDPGGRFALSSAEAVRIYGIANVAGFISDILVCTEDEYEWDV